MQTPSKNVEVSKGKQTGPPAKIHSEWWAFSLVGKHHQPVCFHWTKDRKKATPQKRCGVGDKKHCCGDATGRRNTSWGACIMCGWSERGLCWSLLIHPSPPPHTTPLWGLVVVRLILHSVDCHTLDVLCYVLETLSVQVRRAGSVGVCTCAAR